MTSFNSHPVIDNGIALRLLLMLTTPFKDWPLYKAGTIDEKGKYILEKSKRSKPEQRPSYLEKLILNIKKLINKLPGGENKLKNILAAMVLIQEAIESDENPKYLSESVKIPSNPKSEEMKLQFYKVWKEYLKTKGKRCLIDEDGVAMGAGAVAGGGAGEGSAPTMSTSAIAGYDKPLGMQRRRRKPIFEEYGINLAFQKRFIDDVETRAMAGDFGNSGYRLKAMFSAILLNLNAHRITVSEPKISVEYKNVTISTNKFSIKYNTETMQYNVKIILPKDKAEQIKYELSDSLKFNRFPIRDEEENDRVWSFTTS